MVVLSHFSQYSAFIIAKTRTKSKCKIPPWGTFFRDFPCPWKIQRNDQSGRGPARRRDGKMPDRREKSGSFAPTWKPQRQNRLAEYVGNFLSMWRWCPSLQKCPPKIQNSLDFMTSLSYYAFSDPTKWGDIIGGQKNGASYRQSQGYFTESIFGQGYSKEIGGVHHRTWCIQVRSCSAWCPQVARRAQAEIKL